MVVPTEIFSTSFPIAFIKISRFMLPSDIALSCNKANNAHGDNLGIHGAEPNLDNLRNLLIYFIMVYKTWEYHVKNDCHKQRDIQILFPYALPIGVR